MLSVRQRAATVTLLPGSHTNNNNLLTSNPAAPQIYRRYTYTSEPPDVTCGMWFCCGVVQVYWAGSSWAKSATAGSRTRSDGRGREVKMQPPRSPGRALSTPPLEAHTPVAAHLRFSHVDQSQLAVPQQRCLPPRFSKFAFFLRPARLKRASTITHLEMPCSPCLHAEQSKEDMQSSWYTMNSSGSGGAACHYTQACGGTNVYMPCHALSYFYHQPMKGPEGLLLTENVI